MTRPERYPGERGDELFFMCITLPLSILMLAGTLWLALVPA